MRRGFVRACEGRERGGGGEGEKQVREVGRGVWGGGGWQSGGITDEVMEVDWGGQYNVMCICGVCLLSGIPCADAIDWVGFQIVKTAAFGVPRCPQLSDNVVSGYGEGAEPMPGRWLVDVGGLDESVSRRPGAG